MQQIMTIEVTILIGQVCCKNISYDIKNIKLKNFLCYSTHKTFFTTFGHETQKYLEKYHERLKISTKYCFDILAAFDFLE